MWKHQVIGNFRLDSRPLHVIDARNALRSFVPKNHSGKCASIRQIEVTKVEHVTNVSLWRSYVHTRQVMVDSIGARRDCPWITNIHPSILSLHAQFFPHIKLEANANEALLLHGTEHAESIVKQGFDDRLSTRNLYGRGVYFTTDSCKAEQYCGNPGAPGFRTIIVARVLLGHAFLAEGPMETHQRPPPVNGTSIPHDSTIARPGISKGKGEGKQQIHLEFVVQGSQAYPELIHFT